MLPYFHRAGFSPAARRRRKLRRTVAGMSAFLVALGVESAALPYFIR
jgi:hypothetical protein